ncbi:GlmU family protein [Flavicella marina]|uniref:GlmU family protein n=1 Tax=Flavicella marina TaxID=1475951 RepID=UPI0012644296|nr:GlmU family protein [Flavicella marina]
MNYILYDGAFRENLLPFTYTRPVAEIRIGILTIREKWEKMLGCTVTYLTEEYLEDKFPMVEFEENVFIDASIIPTEKLAEDVSFLERNQAIVYQCEVISFFATQEQEEVEFDSYEMIEYKSDLIRLTSLSEIFSNNYKAIASDFDLLTNERTSSKISSSNTIIGNVENLFVEEGVSMECVSLNVTDGPIYIGKGAVLMEGSHIRGPFSIGESAVLKMGAKIYGGTTVGPNCTVGGEVKNVVFFGNSNKGHDGYLGNSVVGEWCNFGADTNCSNMKNNHSEIKLWSYSEKEFVNSGLQFCGLFLGDYSKLGINTMINTGTVIGVSSNIFGSGFPEKFIPSFSWSGFEKKSIYHLDKAIEDASKMKQLKKEAFTDIDKEILTTVFEISNEYRT